MTGAYKTEILERMHFLFADYVLDTDRRELTRGSVLIGIAPQVFDLLVYLVQNRERVVTKDDLLEAIWRGRTVSRVNSDQPCQCHAQGGR